LISFQGFPRPLKGEISFPPSFTPLILLYFWHDLNSEAKRLAPYFVEILQAISAMMFVCSMSFLAPSGAMEGEKK